MPHVGFMHPLFVEVAVPVVLVLFAAAAYYNTRLLEGLRKYYAPSGMFLLDIFSPRNIRQLLTVWGYWLVITLLLVFAAGMPSVSMAPNFAQKGAVEVEFVIQVNNAMGDESERASHRDGDPGDMYQWGTRLDQVKRYIVQDFLPQLVDNKTGITTVEGVGYNMWDLTEDNATSVSAFQVMLNSFVTVGSAPGAGANYASGFATALAEFDLMESLERQEGDTTKKERFIVLFADGNYSQDGEHLGDPKLLVEQEKELAKRGIHLLVIGMGERDDVTVPHYDPLTHQRDGAFEGQTSLNEKVLTDIVAAVPGADYIYAPPGTKHISYNFPRKAGNLYAVPAESNMYAWLVLAAIALMLWMTFTGGQLLPNIAGIVAAGRSLPSHVRAHIERFSHALSSVTRRSSRNL